MDGVTEVTTSSTPWKCLGVCSVTKITSDLDVIVILNKETKDAGQLNQEIISDIDLVLFTFLSKPTIFESTSAVTEDLWSPGSPLSCPLQTVTASLVKRFHCFTCACVVSSSSEHSSWNGHLRLQLGSLSVFSGLLCLKAPPKIAVDVFFSI